MVMKNFLLKIGCAVILFIAVCGVLSCSQDDSELIVDKETFEIPEDVLVSNAYVGSLHSDALDRAGEIIKEKNWNSSSLTSAQLAYVSETAVINAVQDYISEKEGRTLTSTEKSTLQKEVNLLLSDQRALSLFDDISNYSSIIPVSGTPDLNTLYSQYNISASSQRYLNMMFNAIDTRSNDYDSYLDELFLNVWSSSLSSSERDGILAVISVMKDSYNYWDVRTRRMNAYLRTCLISDGCGAVRGLWKGIGASAGSLIFGPGGAVLTITGSVIVNAATSSIIKAVWWGLLG